MKLAAAIVILSGDFQEISINGAPTTRAGTLTRAAFDRLSIGSGIAAGAVQPRYAREVGLTSDAESLEPRYHVTRCLAPSPEMHERGKLILREARTAVERTDLGRVRKLCCWFPLVLRIPEVKTLLDRLPRRRAAQIAEGRRGHGRPHDVVETLGRIATMTALTREQRISVAEAARILADAVPDLNLTPRALENLYSQLGPLVSCLDGYAVEASALSPQPWDVRDQDELSVYVRLVER